MGAVLVFLLLAVFLGAAIVLGVFALRKRPSDAPTGLFGCGQCGYPAAHVSTMNCPECGADLRIVGIVRPGGRGQFALPLKLIGWSVLMLILGAILTNVALMTVLPQMIGRDFDSHLAGSTSGAIQSVKIYGVSREYFFPLNQDQPFSSSQQYAIYLRPSALNQGVRGDVDLTAGAYSLEVPGKGPLEGSGAFDQSVLESWLIALGMDPAKPDGAMQVQEIIGEIDSGLANWNTAAFPGGFGRGMAFGGSSSSFSGGGNGFQSTSSSSSTSVDPVAWPLGLFILVLAAIWLFGIIRLVKHGALFARRRE